MGVVMGFGCGSIFLVYVEWICYSGGWSVVRSWDFCKYIKLRDFEEICTMD